MKPRTYPHLPGNPVSVTSILSAVFPRPGLEQWKLARAVELGREHPNEAAMGILDRHKGPEMNRGKLVHEAIESTLRGSPVDKMPDRIGWKMFENWLGWFVDAKLSPFTVEEVVHADGYAGTSDMTTKMTVFDWKTATTLPKTPYPDHFAQVAAYGEALHLSRGCIVYISTDGVAEFAVEGKEWARAVNLWTHSLGLCRNLYPEWFR